MDDCCEGHLFFCCLVNFCCWSVEVGTNVIRVRVCARAHGTAAALREAHGRKNKCSVCCRFFFSECWWKAISYGIFIYGLEDCSATTSLTWHLLQFLESKQICKVFYILINILNSVLQYIQHIRFRRWSLFKTLTAYWCKGCFGYGLFNKPPYLVLLLLAAPFILHGPMCKDYSLTGARLICRSMAPCEVPQALFLNASWTN